MYKVAVNGYNIIWIGLASGLHFLDRSYTEGRAVKMLLNSPQLYKFSCANILTFDVGSLWRVKLVLGFAALKVRFEKALCNVWLKLC